MNHYYLFPDGIYESKEEKPTDEKGNFISRSYFKQALDEWLLSCVKYPFGEGEEEKFKSLVYVQIANSKNIQACFVTEHSIAFTTALKAGIKIDSERVKTQVYCPDYKFTKDSNCELCHCPKLAYFVPVEDKPKEESQLTLSEWNEKELKRHYSIVAEKEVEIVLLRQYLQYCHIMLSSLCESNSNVSVGEIKMLRDRIKNYVE